MQHSLARRKEISANLRREYPDRVPLYIPDIDGGIGLDMAKKKILVPINFTVAQFMAELRRSTPSLRSQDGMTPFINKTVIPTATSLFYELYDKYKQDDGFLYMTLVRDNTFG